MTEAFWEALPLSLARKRGMQRFRLGGALVSLTRKSTSLQRNRVLGLGVRHRATENMVDEIMKRFRAAHVARFSFHVSPSPQSGTITEWLKGRGFVLHHNYVKLFRDTRAPAGVATPFTTKRIGKAHASQFVQVFFEVFPWPRDLGAWLVATFGNPDFSHFLVFDGARPVATGLLYTSGNTAWMGWGATLVKWRRRGAHSALIAARIRRAADLGAKWIACATMEPTPGRPSRSYRNLLKQGFEPAYLRPIWVWEKRSHAALDNRQLRAKDKVSHRHAARGW